MLGKEKKRDPQQSFPLLMKALSKQVKYKRKSKYGVDSVTNKLSWGGGGVGIWLKGTSQYH